MQKAMIDHESRREDARQKSVDYRSREDPASFGAITPDDPRDCFVKWQGSRRLRQSPPRVHHLSTRRPERVSPSPRGWTPLTRTTSRGPMTGSRSDEAPRLSLPTPIASRIGEPAIFRDPPTRHPRRDNGAPTPSRGECARVYPASSRGVADVSGHGFRVRRGIIQA